MFYYRFDLNISQSLDLVYFVTFVPINLSKEELDLLFFHSIQVSVEGARLIRTGYLDLAPPHPGGPRAVNIH